MGGYPPHGTGPGRLPGIGGEETDREAPAAEAGRKVGVHLIEYGKSKCGV